MGCDVRLLGIIRGLIAEGVEVSMLFRAHTPVAKRAPSSEKLAAMLKISRGFREEWLRSEQLPPPALYEYVSPANLARLFQRGWFNAVLVFFWFWHDPKPNVAEMVLPALHAYSPHGRRPFVAILSDDAHAIRDAKLGAWEGDRELAANHTARATGHAQREAAAYALADQVLHITPADSAAESAAFPFVRRFGLLRLSLGSGNASSAAASASSAAASASGSAAVARPTLPSAPYVGFLGNGVTPTNSLAVQWFLSACWPALRARYPTLRLRLVGVPPGHRVHADGKVHAACTHADAHCGWASRTLYHGAEAANGIDELGFLDDERMLDEVGRWRMMVVPVLHTTGVVSMPHWPQTLVDGGSLPSPGSAYPWQ